MANPERIPIEDAVRAEQSPGFELETIPRRQRKKAGGDYALSAPGLHEVYTRAQIIGLVEYLQRRLIETAKEI